MNYKRIFATCLLLSSPFVFAKEPTFANKGMVVTEQRLASKIGIDILKAGGNAVDAAVAVGYALSVVDPCCGNIGGGGFMLIHLANGKNIFINFREKAGRLATENMFFHKGLKNDSSNGYLSVAVPGTVLGLDTALKKYGTMTRKRVMQPAIDLARSGFVISPYEANRLLQYENDFKTQPNISAIFLKKHHTLKQGDVLKQPDLANTLRLIANYGPIVFYHGPIAKKIVEASNQQGGILTLEDFANYKVEITKPLQCQYKGYQLFTSPLPGSGVTLCEILAILEHFSLNKSGYRSTQDIKNIVEAMRLGFIDRNNKLADPNFVPDVTEQLLSTSHINQLSQKIKSQETIPHSSSFKKYRELTDTTHYSIIDKESNAVAVTYTLNGFFGAVRIAENTGFFLNNEMDDFITQPGKPNKFGLVQSGTNTIAPGKRPLSSMSPTFVFQHNHLLLILGSPGGPKIITSVLLTLLNLFNYDLNLTAAVNKPRFHFQGEPDTIIYEKNAFSQKTIQALRNLGYDLSSSDLPWGAVAAIMIDKDQLIGVMDARRPDGAAIGY